MTNEKTTIGQLLAAVGSDLHLDCELLLAKVFDQSRSFIYMFPELILTKSQIDRFHQLWMRRLQGEPLAYLLGYKEFWGLNFKVNQHTLIPRPETETIVEYVLSNYVNEDYSLLDVGTGSGAIACAIANERPNWKLTATDISFDSLAIAKMNAKQLGLSNIQFLQGDTFNPVKERQYDIIVSNPPYIAGTDPHLTHLQYEPREALVASDHGMAVLKSLIANAANYLSHEGILIVEHGYDQLNAVNQFSATTDLHNISILHDLAGIARACVFKKI